jgi:RimJ/RimL family protein N-acetyltransferase
VVLRPWKKGDEPAIVRHANDRKVWRNLRDHFPHPYTPSDAVDWIRRVSERGAPHLDFAIVLNGEPIGGIGCRPLDDVHRRVAEIGYWLGRTHWGNGYATEAVITLTRYAFAQLDVDRIEAAVFAWNPASCRVLEKAGYRFEARLARSVFKDGQTTDGLMYARFRDDP